MSLIRLAPLFALALSACGDEAERPVDEAPARPAASATTAPDRASADVAITDAASLVGEYRVAGVNDREIDLPHGVTARISDVGIHVVSDCVNLSWGWFFEQGRLVTERVPVEGCGRGLLAEEEAIVAAFDGATGVGRTPANGIAFTGEGGSVLLFSQ